MAKKATHPGSPGGGEPKKKRRTREHIIADLSVNFVERLALKCGYVVRRPSPDYGFDLYLETFSDNGEVENEYVFFQLKATDAIQNYALTSEESFSFPVSAKDYRYWIEDLMPVFLILFDALLEEGYWLDIQYYEKVHKPVIQGDTLNVRIPRSHVLGVETIRIMRQRKNGQAQMLRTTLKRKTGDG